MKISPLVLKTNILLFLKLIVKVLMKLVFHTYLHLRYVHLGLKML